MNDTKPTSIDEYISTFPDDTQIVLQKIRETIQATAPGAVETISYGIAAFKLKGKILLYFAGYKKHVSVYPVGADEIEAVSGLSPYQSGRGTVKFPLDKPIPYQLIKKIAELKMSKLVGELK